jgi:hypothetical protein
VPGLVLASEMFLTKTSAFMRFDPSKGKQKRNVSNLSIFRLCKYYGKRIREEKEIKSAKCIGWLVLRFYFILIYLFGGDGLHPEPYVVSSNPAQNSDFKYSGQ